MKVQSCNIERMVACGDNCILLFRRAGWRNRNARSALPHSQPPADAARVYCLLPGVSLAVQAACVGVLCSSLFCPVNLHGYAHRVTSQPNMLPSRPHTLSAAVWGASRRKTHNHPNH